MNKYTQTDSDELLAAQTLMLDAIFADEVEKAAAAAAEAAAKTEAA